MFIEVKREITVISHYSELESETIFHALRTLQEKMVEHGADANDSDTVNSMLSELETIPEKIHNLREMEIMTDRKRRK